MNTYLVTGGAGFLGSHLCKALLEHHKVYVLDNLSSGQKSNVPKGVELIVGDVADYTLVKEIMAKVDGCFHLAAIVSIPLCNMDLLHAHQINLTSTLNLLQASIDCPRKKPIVFASSCAVYGNNKNLPNIETSVTIPVSFYGTTKLSSENYGYFANELYQVPFTALRLFNLYGYGQKLDSPYSGVITLFLNALLQDHPCIIYGNGRQSRDFIYVEDVVRFFIRAMETSTDKARLYNVCTGQSVTVRTIARLLSQILGKKLNIEYQKPRVGDLLHSVGSPLKARRELKLIAQTSLACGLKQLTEDLFRLRKQF